MQIIAGDRQRAWRDPPVVRVDVPAADPRRARSSSSPIVAGSRPSCPARVELPRWLSTAGDARRSPCVPARRRTVGSPIVRWLRVRRTARRPTVLVTGGCGFIGVNLARACATRRCPHRRVRQLLDRPRRGRARPRATTTSSRATSATRTRCAPRPQRRRRRRAPGAHTGVVDSVDDPRRDLEVNVVGTLNALLAARDGGASSFVFASSGAPLGSVEPPGHEGLAPRPLSPYGASKLAGEGYCSAFAGSYGLRRDGAAVHQRLRAVQLPQGQRRGALHEADHGRRAARRLRRRRADPRLPLRRRSLRRGVAALDRRPPGGLYQLGTGTETSVNELVEQLLVALFARPRGHGPRTSRPAAVRSRRSFSDISRARGGARIRPDDRAARRIDDAPRDWFVQACAHEAAHGGAGVLGLDGVMRGERARRTRRSTAQFGDLVARRRARAAPDEHRKP